MGLEPLTLLNLGASGAIAKANELLREASQDVLARGDVAKARRVILCVDLSPQMVENGEVGQVGLKWTADLKLPGVSKSAGSAIVEHGEVLVNPLSEDARQMLLAGVSEAMEPKNITHLEQGKGKN